MSAPDNTLSKQEFDELFQRVCNWGVWGAEDERGTLNYITPACTKAAAALVQTGCPVSMALPMNKVAGPDNAHPVLHYMTQAFDGLAISIEPAFAPDFIAGEIHGDCHTHIDALCHAAYEGHL
jgi:hypothetical protein